MLPIRGPVSRSGASGATINKEISCLSSILSDYGVWEQVRRDVRRLEENEEAGRALSRDGENRRATAGELDSAVYGDRSGFEHRNAAQGNQDAQVEEHRLGEPSPQSGRE